MIYVEESLRQYVDSRMDTLIEIMHRLHAIELEIFIKITKRTNNVEKTGHYLEPYNFDFKFEYAINHPYLGKSIHDMTTRELKDVITAYSSTINKIQNRFLELCDILESIDDIDKIDKKIGLVTFISKEQIKQDILSTFRDDFLYAIITGDILIDHNYMIVSKESTIEQSFNSDIRKRNYDEKN